MRKEGSSKARQHNDNDNQGISSYLIHHKNRLIWYSDPVRGSKSDQIICMLCSSVGAVEFAEDVEGSDEANKQSDMMRAPWWHGGWEAQDWRLICVEVEHGAPVTTRENTPLPDVVARRRRIPTAAVAMLHCYVGRWRLGGYQHRRRR